jgi:DNA replication protein DnaC
MKAAAEVCPECSGSGWKPVPGGPDRGVTRCDCRLRARGGAMIAAARIPKRYEHCELSNFKFEGPHLRLAGARMAACRFVEEYPFDKTGLLLIGNTGLGKTHLAAGIAKALIREKGIECVFYDYADLLKQIQDSYNPTVQATELGLLRPVFETEVLVLDDLGSVRPTEWRWDTVRLILNTRYNDGRTTIITTNFPDDPPGALASKRKKRSDPNPPKYNELNSEPDQPEWTKYTLGDRITETMRSRLHEMCRIVKMDGDDYRENLRKARFG